VQWLVNLEIMSAMVFTNTQKRFPLALLLWDYSQQFYQLCILPCVLDLLPQRFPHQAHLVLVNNQNLIFFLGRNILHICSYQYLNFKSKNAFVGHKELSVILYFSAMDENND
jgi:hypothetical protein